MIGDRSLSPPSGALAFFALATLALPLATDLLSFQAANQFEFDAAGPGDLGTLCSGYRSIADASIGGSHREIGPSRRSPEPDHGPGIERSR